MNEKNLKIIVMLISLAVLGLILIQFYWIKNALRTEENNFNKNVAAALSAVVNKIDKKETAEILIKNISNGKDKKSASSRAVVKILKLKNDSTHTNTIITSLTGNDTRVIKLKAKSNSKKTIITATIDSSGITSHKFSLNTNIDSLLKNKSEIIESVISEIILTEKNISIEERVNRSEIDSLLQEEFAKYGITADYNFSTQKNKTNELNNSQYQTKLFPNNVISNPGYLELNFPDKKSYLLKSIWFVLLISILLTNLIVALFYITIKMLIKQKQITEVKNDLLNNITHQLKTPIATISIAADIIAKTTGSQEEKNLQHLSIIKNENNRLKKMVETILTAARLDKNNIEPDKKETDINKLIKEVALQFDLIIKKLKGEIKINIPEKEIIINADESLLKNAISNLLDNAIKYTDENPVIKISIIKIKNKIQLVIEDNGIGIPKKYTEKIFETFYRIPTGNIHNVKGNGIGLTITKKIIEAHGGSITVHHKNKGTVFKINLPLN